jgi:putative ABC transport system permease protein
VLRALRSLTHFWKASLAVLLGAAVASTVLTGALLTGDSVRGSLRDLTLERLGGIDHALVAPSFFRAELAAELERRQAARVAPAIVLRGTAVHADSRARAAGVEIYGVDPRFSRLHGANLSALQGTPDSGQLFLPLIVNESLRRELGAQPGDAVLLSFERPGEVPRETLLGEKEVDDVLATRRFSLAQVLPDRGIGGFTLAARSSRPLTAFVPLADLQKALEREDRVNALFASPPPGAGTLGLRSAVRLEDLGLRLMRGDRHVALESTEYFLDAAAVETAEELARAAGIPSRRVFTYLATGLRTRGRLLPYSMVAGLSAPAGLTLTGGSPAPVLRDLRDGDVLLNRWAADDLQAGAGEIVDMSFLAMAPGGGLVEQRAPLRVRGIVEMTGLGADRTLTPTFPGLDEAQDMAAWDPPFPVDLDLIRPEDERYWDEHGAAPKAFVSLETAQRLWSTRFGRLTAVRFEGDPARIEPLLRREIPRRVPLEPFGLALRPVKREGLAAATGSTDFAGLFLAFSVFLILSAVLLAGLLFSLAVERRSGELGLLLAVGHPLRAVRRRLWTEGLLLAASGALLGLAGAVGYAWLLMAGLRSWWLPAVGTPDLFLHVAPSTLAVGWCASVTVVFLTIAWTVRRLARIPPSALLAGSTSGSASGVPGRFARRLAPGSALAAAALFLYALLSGNASSPALSFGIGACLLVAGLALASRFLRHPRPSRHLSLLRMAARNGAASPGRSLLSITLVACACFVLVVVAANRRDVREELRQGAGGFPLYAESTVPLAHDPGTPAGRLELGLSAAEDPALQGVSFLSFRVLPGDDVSCLNLFRPGRPRLLGVPPEIAGREGFRVRRTLEEAGNPWDLLTEDLGSGVIPAFADANSATWILKLRLGEDLVLDDEAGRPVRLRLVGLLERSLFQSEMLVSEENLLRHFPSRAGRSFFLIDAPAQRSADVTRVLEERLDRHGFDVSRTAERLAAYHAVESTYLATFQALGGFGLLLGTLGLGIALLRGLLERRGELALLRAVGFRRRRIAWMVLAENGVLLLLGVGIGTVAGLLAAAPHLAAEGGAIPWASLLGTLAGVVAAGLLSCAAALRSALAAPLVPVLKEER